MFFFCLCDHSYLALPRIIVESVASATRSKPSDCFYSISFTNSKIFCIFLSNLTQVKDPGLLEHLSPSLQVCSPDIWGVYIIMIFEEFEERFFAHYYHLPVRHSLISWQSPSTLSSWKPAPQGSSYGDDKFITISQRFGIANVVLLSWRS